MKISKRGFDSNQMFIYVASAIVLGVVVMISFSAVSTFMTTSEDIQALTIVTDLRDAVTQASREYRSVRILNVDIPGKYSRFCMIDYDKVAPTPSSLPSYCQTLSFKLTPVSCTYWYDAKLDPTYERKNVIFFDGQNRISGMMRIDKLTLPPTVGYLCTPQERKQVSIRLEGKAKMAEVTIV